VNLPTKKAQALLAYLGLRLGQPHSRDTLAVPLWMKIPLSTFAKNSW
jgi:DNA-binding SARP family transcriptional activator